MELFFTTLKGEVRRLAKNRIRLRFIGERSAFSEKLQHEMQLAERATAEGTGMVLNVAANYGGRWDITQAARRLASEVKVGRIQPEEITTKLITGYLSTTDLIEPDLFIRTGGEQRISNFLLWQLAYTELYFTDILWPDFEEEALDQAFKSFSSRQRRFGKTGEQISTIPRLIPNA
jgi:undecaprenyl diphosphate synthase